MKEHIRLWLDDVRDPLHFGRLGWLWVKNYHYFVKAFEEYNIVEVSLDCDLTTSQSIGMPCDQPSGIDCVAWMIEHSHFPPKGITIHSANRHGAMRMHRMLVEAKVTVPLLVSPADFWINPLRDGETWE
jgi:hypothetical protein